MNVVPHELLLALANQTQPAQSKSAPSHEANGQAGDHVWIDNWIAAYGLEVRGPDPWQGGRRWVLGTCPWNVQHTNGSAYIVERADGKLAAGCHHNSCSGKGWHDLRDIVEPDWRRQRQSAAHDRPGGNYVAFGAPPCADDPWPNPLNEEAFYGVAGEVVRLIEPHSEADPAALLLQLLIGFGNLIGRHAHFRAEADYHPAKLNGCLVGATSKGRKGTSWGQVNHVLAAVDPTWAATRVVSGLSSGEGLIWQVRDAIMKREPIREKRRIVGYQEVEADPGVSDKRLLVLESEMGSVLRVIRREGNTLSAVVRDAWDKDCLRTLTKNSPAVSTGCHISIIGHITRDELRRHVTETEMANGFCNRFIWCCVRRSKPLPEGGALQSVDFTALVRRLQQAAEFADGGGQFYRDARARDVWAAVYPELSAGGPGLLGAVTSRAEAITMRLALIYALLDLSSQIRPEHLTAALAIWEYAEASARHIFGSARGDPTADQILRALREVGSQGMTRTEIRNLFDRHCDGAEINRALGVLAEVALARCDRPTGDGPGRPVERWFAVT